MDILTHQGIDQELCGKPLTVRDGFSKIEFTATQRMAADETGLVHGGFIFGLADYAAMIAVNHPNVVLGAASVKFLKPVRIGDVVIAEAKVGESSGKKNAVDVTVRSGDETVFNGVFTCFTLDNHILA